MIAYWEAFRRLASVGLPAKTLHKDIRVKTIRAFRAAHFQVAVKTELFLGPLVSADRLWRRLADVARKSGLPV